MCRAPRAVDRIGDPMNCGYFRRKPPVMIGLRDSARLAFVLLYRSSTPSHEQVSAARGAPATKGGGTNPEARSVTARCEGSAGVGGPGRDPTDPRRNV